MIRIPPALRHRPYRLYWVGMIFVWGGSQMQLWTMFWHIRSLTDQPLALGALDEQLLQHALFDHGNPCLARGDVDQQLGAHRGSIGIRILQSYAIPAANGREGRGTWPQMNAYERKSLI